APSATICISKQPRARIALPKEPSSFGAFRLLECAHGRCAPATHTRLTKQPRRSPLLSRLVLDRRVDLLLHRLQVEGRRVLHRREVDGSLGKVGYLLLDEDE